MKMGKSSFGQAKRKETSDQQFSKFNQNPAKPESKQEQSLDNWTSEGGFPGNPQNKNNKNKSEKENVHISASDEGNKKSDIESVGESEGSNALSTNNQDADEESSSAVNSSPSSPAKRSAYEE
jgi:hypothetical protein